MDRQTLAAPLHLEAVVVVVVAVAVDTVFHLVMIALAIFVVAVVVAATAKIILAGLRFTLLALLLSILLLLLQMSNWVFPALPVQLLHLLFTIIPISTHVVKFPNHQSRIHMPYSKSPNFE